MGGRGGPPPPSPLFCWLSSLRAPGLRVPRVRPLVWGRGGGGQIPPSPPPEQERMRDGRSGEPLTVAPAWKPVPSWYVVATQDRAINPELERFMAKRMHARVTELPAGHLVFIARAQDIARIIESASQ